MTLNILISIIGFLFILSPIVFIHELGHFWFARRFGVKVEVFSVGFGPKIFAIKDKYNTIWQIAAIPIGGYVKMLGELNVSSEYKSDVSDVSTDSNKDKDKEKYKEIYKENFETFVWSKFIGKIRPKIAIYETKYRLDMWINGEEDDEDVIDNDFVLVDYGLSFNFKERDRDDYPERIQTRYYICPEVLAEQKYNETCDMWSLGCMIYEWLTGEILFRPDSDKDFDRDCYHIKLMWLKVGTPTKDIQKEVGKLLSILLRKNSDIHLENLNETSETNIQTREAS